MPSTESLQWRRVLERALRGSPTPKEKFTLGVSKVNMSKSWGAT